MFDTSRDLLFISLAACAIVFTTFACWLLYYFIAVIKDVRGVTKSVKNKIDLLDEILNALKDKINSTASYVGLIVNGMEKVVDYVQKRKPTANAPKKKSAKVKMEE
ncbi:MAG TPA: hypothetical protein PLR18_03570 [bacterium]|mgnify:CR=1 FL=1|nr:hypothetical protein [bacterium]